MLVRTEGALKAEQEENKKIRERMKELEDRIRMGQGVQGPMPYHDGWRIEAQRRKLDKVYGGGRPSSGGLDGNDGGRGPRVLRPVRASALLAPRRVLPLRRLQVRRVRRGPGAVGRRL